MESPCSWTPYAGAHARGVIFFTRPGPGSGAREGMVIAHQAVSPGWGCRPSPPFSLLISQNPREPTGDGWCLLWEVVVDFCFKWSLLCLLLLLVCVPTEIRGA